MSWRRFKTLLDGLSPWGALATHYKDALKKQREEEQREAGAQSAQVASFWTQIASIRPKD